jgi:hypothetical protein
VSYDQDTGGGICTVSWSALAREREWQLRLTGVAVALNMVIEFTDVAFNYPRA